MKNQKKLIERIATSMMYEIKTFFKNAWRTDRFANPELFIIFLFLFLCFFWAASYHGAHSSEEATFIRMPALDQELTPHQRFFKETELVGVSADLVQIRLENGQDTFAVLPRNIPYIAPGSKIKVSNFWSKAYYVKQ